MRQLLQHQEKHDYACHHQIGKWKCPPMTYREDKAMEACDNREKVSDNLSVSRPKTWGIMTTQKRPLECLPNNQGRPHINNQRRDHEGDPNPRKNQLKPKRKTRCHLFLRLRNNLGKASYLSQCVFQLHVYASSLIRKYNGRRHLLYDLTT